jgi:alkanesulfonate monooxygenase SsuD/methylene tetrahydromethanopterin reductase-like flavin-dependent oxidoreductase (luciferase family)
MSLQVGVGLWTGQGADNRQSYRDVAELAAAAEAAGFDSFWVTEHHGLPDGYLPSPLTVLAALAPVTSRITLGTGVVLAPLHHPLRLAEDAAVVDLLSGGRLVLGLGLGYAEHEYRAFGVDPRTRGARLEALVGALRTAWTGTSFSCPDLGLDDVRVTPTPGGRIPIWLGGYAAAAVGRAGRIADGHLVGRGEPGIVEAASARLGAPRAGFTRAVNVTCVLDAPGGGAGSARAAFGVQQQAYEAIQAGRTVYSRPVAVGADVDAYVQVKGNVDEVVAGLRGVLATLRAWPEVHLVLRLLFPEPLPVQRVRLATFGSEVLPRLREGR